MPPRLPSKVLRRLPSIHENGRFVTDEGTATTAWLTQVIWVLCFGVSAHACKNAFAPAQPELERAGLAPSLYALVAVSPMLGSLLFPYFWGVAYKDHEERVLIAVPMGQLIGQVLVFGGLWAIKQDGMDTLGMVFLFFGFVLFSCCHGGAHVVQCAVMQRVLPEGLTTGFVAAVGMTHLIAVCCNFVVPRVMDAAGILGVQAVLLAPGLLSAFAGCKLAAASRIEGFSMPMAMTPAPVASKNSVAAKLYRGLSESVLSDASPLVSQTARFSSMCGGMSVVWYIGLWKALLMGTLMAFRTVQNLLLVTYFHLSMLQAGSFVAATQLLALILLPSCGCLFELLGRRFVILSLTWLSFASVLAISAGPRLGTAVWYTAFTIIAIVGTMVPVLAQAIIPDYNTRSAGRAYGLLEAMFSGSQIFVTLLVGFVRQHDHGGFTDSLVLFNCMLFLACLVSVCLIFAIQTVTNNDSHRQNNEPLVPARDRRNLTVLPAVPDTDSL